MRYGHHNPNRIFFMMPFIYEPIYLFMELCILYQYLRMQTLLCEDVHLIFSCAQCKYCKVNIVTFSKFVYITMYMSTFAYAGLSFCNVSNGVPMTSKGYLPILFMGSL